jgi:hypothetical protein
MRPLLMTLAVFTHMKTRFVTDAADNICPIHPPVEVAPTDMRYGAGGKWPDHLIFE